MVQHDSIALLPHSKKVLGLNLLANWSLSVYTWVIFILFCHTSTYVLKGLQEAIHYFIIVLLKFTVKHADMHTHMHVHKSISVKKYFIISSINLCV